MLPIHCENMWALLRAVMPIIKDWLRCITQNTCTPHQTNISNNWAPHTCSYRVMNTYGNMCHTYSMHAPQIMNTLTMKHSFTEICNLTATACSINTQHMFDKGMGTLITQNMVHRDMNTHCISWSKETWIPNTCLHTCTQHNGVHGQTRSHSRPSHTVACTM